MPWPRGPGCAGLQSCCSRSGWGVMGDPSRQHCPNPRLQVKVTHAHGVAPAGCVPQGDSMCPHSQSGDQLAPFETSDQSESRTSLCLEFRTSWHTIPVLP